MKNCNRLFIYTLGALISLLPLPAFAQQINVVTTFDYPGAGNSTTPLGINRRGDIAGYFLDASGVTRGFVRSRSDGFSAPIVEPNDTGNFTRCLGINNAQTITGDFFNVADNYFHGYLLSGGVFTQFDFGGPVSTDVFGINDAGNFVGAFGSNTQPNQGFLNIDGTSTVISIPGATYSFAYGINNSDRVVGTYTDGASIVHGFLRNRNGALIAPIDFPGSTSTTLLGINDKGWMVGRYQIGDGLDHGFFLKMPNSFVAFDYPGAVQTSLNGINTMGLISGRYTDGAGLRHGFVARVTP